MTEVLDQIWSEYRPVNVIKDSIVIDIGSSEGYFTEWAKSQGAIVDSYDARYGLAVGPYDGTCEVKGEGLGAYIVPGQGTTKMISLKTILNKHPRIDFLKCDIEGGEYEIFNCDISNVERLSIEFHAWTTPDKPIAGLGLRDVPMPKSNIKELIKTIKKTHTVEIVGKLEAGGYLHGVRK